MKVIAWITFVSCTSPVCGIAAGDQSISFPEPPRLAITQAELEGLKNSDRFEQLRQQRASQADALLAKGISIPDRAGDWIFYYACKEDGTTLRPVSEAEHECPRCKKIFDDERTQAAYRTKLHYGAERAAQTLGEAFAYTDDPRYAMEVKRILLEYANDYPKYPKRRDRWGRTGWFAPLGGRRYAQSLDEAVGVVRLAKAYDLTRASPVWNDAERRRVEKDLFRTVADTLLWFNQGINNHQTWYNAGLMAIASVLGDEQLVRKVLTMAGGFYFQLERSVTSDGLWYEGTMAYHHYALQAMREIVEAGRRLGLKLHEEPKFRAMIEAPLKFAYPNGQFPAINDSDLSNIRQFQDEFQWASRVYRDSILRGDSPALATQSEHLAGAGLVALRQGKGRGAACAFIDYGEHGGGHGHPDKLNICLYALGREWVPDPGRLTYSHPEHKSWCKQTVAHNTVVLDGISQSPTTGRCLWFRSEKDYSACAVESSGAYAGSVLRRYLLLTERMLVDVFEVENSRPRQTDWIVHAISDEVVPLKELGTGEPIAPGNSNGYQHLTDPVRWTAQGNTSWDFKDKTGTRLRLLFHASSPEDIFTSRGIGYDTTQRVPCLLRRRTAKATRFITVFDLSGKGDYAQSVHWDEKRKEVVTATTEGAWRISFTPCDHSVRYVPQPESAEP